VAKTPDQIRAEIAEARDQFADGVRGLSSQVHPSVIKQQTVEHVKDAVMVRVNTAKEFVMDESGVRWDHIGTVVIVVAALLVTRGTLRGVKRWIFR